MDCCAEVNPWETKNVVFLEEKLDYHRVGGARPRQ